MNKFKSSLDTLSTIIHRDTMGTWLTEHGLLGDVAEIGVMHAGYSKQVLYQWKGRRYYMVDPWLRQDEAIYLERTDHVDYDAKYRDAVAVAKQFPCVNILRDFSANAAKLVPDGSLDWVFIDANHSYEAVLSDMDTWWPKLKPGGVFSGHDYELDTKWPNWCEVKPAVDRWMQEHGIEFIVTECMSWWAMKPAMICENCVWWPENFRAVNPNTPIVLDKCWHPQIRKMTDWDFTCVHYTARERTEFNVPNHLKHGVVIPRGEVDGACEILIVTHFKDMPWLEYCLQSIKRHLTGFQGVTVAHPAHEAEMFAHLPERYGARLHGYDEFKDKGMVQHMLKMAEADLIVPAGTKYVLHCDADCIFTMPTTPGDYFQNGKPYYLVRSWDSLTTEDPYNPNSKVVSDCLQWKKPTDAQLGFDTQWYTMCMNTAVLPIGFYRKYREHIESVHGVPYGQYMLAGRNSFPQTVMDWTAMGAFAEKFMHDEIAWIDVEKDTYPVDRKKAYWSHGGITPTIRMEIEGFIAPKLDFPAKVWVFANCYNEKDMIPFFLRHYGSFAERIIVWDDSSTDGSRELLAAHPKVTLLDWPFEEGIENNEWLLFAYAVYPMARGSTDFIIWADFDEFIYHPDMKAAFLWAMQNPTVEVLLSSGYDMIGDGLPKDNGKQIYELLKTGVPNHDYSKPIVFRPEATIRWVRGKHSMEECDPKCSEHPIFQLLHYRCLGAEHTAAKNAIAYRRVRDKSCVVNCAPTWTGKHSPKWAEEMKAKAVDVLALPHFDPRHLE